MYRKDFIEREFEKLALLLGYILNLKKEKKPLLEMVQAANVGLKDLFGEDFDLKTVEHDTDVNALTPQKQQALADILFEFGITAHQQHKPEAAVNFLQQYIHMLSLLEKNTTTFSFQNIANKGIAQKLLLEL